MSDVPLLEKAILVDKEGNDCELFKLNDVCDALRKFQEGYDEADEEEACLISCENCNLDVTSFIINNKNLCFRCAFNEVFGVLETQDNSKKKSDK